MGVFPGRTGEDDCCCLGFGNGGAVDFLVALAAGFPGCFAFAFFVVFHLLNTFGERLAHEAVLTVFEGMWLSTMVLIPVGIFLTYKAMHDSQLFNSEAYYRIFSTIKRFIGNFRFSKSSLK